MTSYHDTWVKIDIDIARISISNIVAMTMTNCLFNATRFRRGGDVIKKWKKNSPAMKNAGSISQSIAHRCAIEKSKNRGVCDPTITTLRTIAAVKGCQSHVGR